MEVTEEISKAVFNNQDNINKSENETINELDKFLNGKVEDNFEDFEEITSHSLPDPTLRENGMWSVPGTTKQFTTIGLARRAMRRYANYRKEDDAAKLIYGTSYEEYIYGKDD